MKLIVLDRDGVINQDSDAYVKSVDEWIPLAGSIDAIARLTQAGHLVAVATNQSGLARGYFEQQDLDQMHEKMHQLVAAAGGKIDYLSYCPHGPDDGCRCRKPAAGMIEEILLDLDNPEVTERWIVGDSLRDLQAGDSQGLRSALVRTGKGAKTLAEKSDQLPTGTLVFDDLADFTDQLISDSLSDS